MTDSRFADRMQAETYADDPVVGVYRTDASESDALWLSERLFERLVSTARGYELHLLPMLGGSDPVRLSAPMARTLIEEVEFVAERLNDDLARSTAQTLARYLASQLRRGDENMTFTVEGE